MLAVKVSHRYIEEGEFGEPLVDCMRETERRRDIAAEVNTKLAIQASFQFQDVLKGILNGLVEHGEASSAEALAAKRLRIAADPYEVAAVHLWLSTHEASQDNFGEAVSQARASERCAEEIGSPWMAAAAEVTLAGIYEKFGKSDLAQEFLIKALSGVERGKQSVLYIPEVYEAGVPDAVNRQLRAFLDNRLLSGREREALDFCNTVLRTSSTPLHRGFLYQYMGKAENLRALRECESGSPELAAAFGRAEAYYSLAERYFVAADSPVYAALVTISRVVVERLGKDLSLETIELAGSYINQAIAQLNKVDSQALATEIDYVMKLYDHLVARYYETPAGQAVAQKANAPWN